LSKARDGAGCQIGHGQAILIQLVGSQSGWPAGVREQGDPVAHRFGLGRKGEGDIGLLLQ